MRVHARSRRDAWLYTHTHQQPQQPLHDHQLLTESLEDVKHAGVIRANRLHVGEVVVHVVDAVASHQSVGRRGLVPVDGHARVGDFLEDHFQRLAWH